MKNSQTGVSDYAFARERGVVWVCDIRNSTHYLNDDHDVDAIEEFLPRFYWLASRWVEALGGRFVKSTGDGFLAWFPCALERHLKATAERVCDGAQALSFVIDATQLNVPPQTRPFRIGHGLTYEPDALTISTENTWDLLGRDVVTAFRLAGAATWGPAIAAHKPIVELVDPQHMQFKHWLITDEEILKHFKGERRGVRHLYRSAPKRTYRRSVQTVVRSTKKLVARTESGLRQGEAQVSRLGAAHVDISALLHTGPAWAQETYHTLILHIHEILDVLKTSVAALESADAANLPHKGPTLARHNRARGEI